MINSEIIQPFTVNFPKTNVSFLVSFSWIMFFFFCFVFMCTPGSINQTSVGSFILKNCFHRYLVMQIWAITWSCISQIHLLMLLWGNYGGLSWMTSDRGDVWKKKQWRLLKRLGRMLLYHQLYQNQGVYFIDRRATMTAFLDGQHVSTQQELDLISCW